MPPTLYTNPQTRELIRDRKMSHKHNNKDLSLHAKPPPNGMMLGVDASFKIKDRGENSCSTALADEFPSIITDLGLPSSKH